MELILLREIECPFIPILVEPLQRGSSFLQKERPPCGGPMNTNPCYKQLRRLNMIETNDNPQHRTTSAVENYIAANRQLVNEKDPLGADSKGAFHFQ